MCSSNFTSEINLKLCKMDIYNELIEKIKKKGVKSGVMPQELQFIDNKINEINNICKEIEEYISSNSDDNLSISVLNAVLFRYEDKDIELSRVNLEGDHASKGALIEMLLRSKECRRQFLTPYIVHILKYFSPKVDIDSLLSSIGNMIDDLTNDEAVFLVITALDDKLALISTGDKEEIKPIFRELLGNDNMIRQIMHEIAFEKNAEMMMKKTINKIKN